MIELSSVVWESTRKKAGEWASQPCVREGLLTLFDAACMMSSEGYGGIFDTCSKYTQADINGYFEALKSEIHKQGGVLEDYPPVQRYVNGRRQDVFPVAAFLAYCNRTGTGDNRYFSRRVDELGGKDAGCGIQKERPTESRPTESRPTAARVMSSPDVVPFEWCDSDLFPSLIAEDVPDGPDASVLDTVELYDVDHAVINMLSLDPNRCRDRWGMSYEFKDQLSSRLWEELRDSVEEGEYCFRLAGYTFRNPLNAYESWQAAFPREAYYQWWKDDQHGLPCPAWFDDLRKSEEATEADGAAEVCEADIEVDNVPPPEELSPLKPEELPDSGCMEIVPGITVELMRGLLDPNDDRYCPKLLAAVRVKQKIIPREREKIGGLPRTQKKKYEKECMSEAEKVLETMGLFDPNKRSLGIVSNLDKSAVARILDRDNRKTGRPNSKKKPFKALRQ